MIEYIGYYYCETCDQHFYGDVTFRYNGTNLKELWALPFPATVLCPVCFELHPCELGAARLTRIRAASVAADKDGD